MEKKCCVNIEIKTPSEANVFDFLAKLRSFLNEAGSLGEITTDFTTITIIRDAWGDIKSGK